MAASAGGDAPQAGPVDGFGQGAGQGRGDDVAAQVELGKGQQLYLQCRSARAHALQAVEVLGHRGGCGGGAAALPEGQADAGSGRGWCRQGVAQQAMGRRLGRGHGGWQTGRQDERQDERMGGPKRRDGG